MLFLRGGRHISELFKEKQETEVHVSSGATSPCQGHCCSFILAPLSRTRPIAVPFTQHCLAQLVLAPAQMEMVVTPSRHKSAGRLSPGPQCIATNTNGLVFCLLSRLRGTETSGSKVCRGWSFQKRRSWRALWLGTVQFHWCTHHPMPPFLSIISESAISSSLLTLPLTVFPAQHF